MEVPFPSVLLGGGASAGWRGSEVSPGPQGRGRPPGALLTAAGPVFVPAGQVHRHLDQHEVRYLQFAFRWMNNLLMREVPLRCTIRLWDTYQVSAPRALPPAGARGASPPAACCSASVCGARFRLRSILSTEMPSF